MRSGEPVGDIIIGVVLVCPRKRASLPSSRVHGWLRIYRGHICLQNSALIMIKLCGVGLCVLAERWSVLAEALVCVVTTLIMMFKL